MFCETELLCIPKTIYSFSISHLIVFAILFFVSLNMTSLLRQIVASPRVRHEEAGLDLCYVTDNIIATSGPSGTYPQRAYRNPLNALVKFLDHKHKHNWAIWEFRAEGTGYPDSEVYDRIWHYPWPDHHPPPFALIPNIMASMRNWLHGEKGRVVVVHCKAGKGRSGTASCSYLISEEGWKLEDAVKRFTERRMRPGFGSGVSIPSQVRWLTYVDRWSKGGKIYVERQVEVLEVHIWGLRDGVKISVDGFVEEGKTIKTFHTFTKEERELINGTIIEESGFMDVVNDVMGRNDNGKSSKDSKNEVKQNGESEKGNDEEKLDTPAEAGSSTALKTGDAVFRPSKRVVLPTNDINIDFERRNKAAWGYTMVTAVSHVWFNAFFEGNGDKQDGNADVSGVFELEWDKLDGIKGSSRKGTRAFDKVAVVWRALDSESGGPQVVITEPEEGEEVKQSTPADWRGVDHSASGANKDIGIRASSPVGDDEGRTRKAKVALGHEGSHLAEKMEHAAVRPRGPDGEESIHAPTDSQNSLFPKNHPAVPHSSSEPALSGNLDGTADNAVSTETPRVQSPEPTHSSVAGIVQGVAHISTNALPDGKPEAEMETAHQHALGHLKKEKKLTSSS
ncbi:phosphatidylinositol-3,4,5-trisphosphate 3-phosphatase [Patellaria atrata CBS 101060]|uniref:phosphatidylinositol-3,4,5-trisphosphate 3-phosphatase n=1 Tax=Patellaria atrata CBS 101060 TaxID=1346257 RepID=A0A9P4S8E4_9PEZI|nr:phosphatidylinositol-3,4,5-trisphosphate 3-phosphatase [Patellaria atrata CBS 101060]